MAPSARVAPPGSETASSARQLSLEDSSDLSSELSPARSRSAWGARPRRWPAGLVGRPSCGRCCAWSLFVALAVLASFAAMAVWQRIATVAGLTQPDKIEASGVCSIELRGTIGDDGVDMSGWELSAQRWIPRDMRDDGSTYASVQNISAWPQAGVWWEVAPHADEPGAFRIRIRRVVDDLLSGAGLGWYLGAARFYDADERGLFSIYASIVSEPTTVLPAGSGSVVEMVEWQGGNATTAPLPGASVASSAWVLEPLSEAGAYNIRLKTGPPGVEEMAGWFLSARRFFNKERRNADSTYVSLVRDEDESTAWILKCSSCCVGLGAGRGGDEFPDFYK